MIVLDTAYFDPSQVQGQQTGVPEAIQMIHALALGVQAIFSAGWCFVLFCIAGSEWSRARPPAMPLLTRSGRTPWLAIGAGGAIGVAFGIVTSAVFLFLHVGEGQLVQGLVQNYPALKDAPPLLLLVIGLLYVVGPAISEEILFRGALLGFLCA